MRFVTLNQPCYTTYGLRVTMSSRVTNFHVTLPTLQQLINVIKTSQLQHLVMCILLNTEELMWKIAKRKRHFTYYASVVSPLSYNSPNL